MSNNLRKTVSITLSYICTIIILISLAFFYIGPEALVDLAKPYKPFSTALMQVGKSGSAEGISTANSSPTIIYLGDSSVTWPPDAIPQSQNYHLYTAGLLSSILADDKKMPANVYQWSYGGANMFDYYCLLSRAQKFSPSLIIIPINWQFFGRHTRVSFPQVAAFAPLLEGFNTGYQNPLDLMNISWFRHLWLKLEILSVYPLGFKVFLKDRVSAFIHFQPLKSEEISVTEILFEATAELARDSLGEGKHVKDLYPMRIPESNMHLQLFRSVVDAASRRKMATLFYLNPVNVELLEKAGVFERLPYELSRHFIAEMAKREHIYFLDLCDLLSEDFFAGDWGQHYTEAGRRKIAEALANEAVEILQDASSQRSVPAANRAHGPNHAS